MASLLFFGRLGDIASNQNVVLPETVADTQSLQTWLAAQHDGFAEAMAKQGARVAVNKTIITHNQPITDTDEIAFMSALSGG